MTGAHMINKSHCSVVVYHYSQISVMVLLENSAALRKQLIVVGS